ARVTWRAVVGAPARGTVASATVVTEASRSTSAIRTPVACERARVTSVPSACSVPADDDADDATVTLGPTPPAPVAVASAEGVSVALVWNRPPRPATGGPSGLPMPSTVASAGTFSVGGCWAVTSDGLRYRSELDSRNSSPRGPGVKPAARAIVLSRVSEVELYTAPPSDSAGTRVSTPTTAAAPWESMTRTSGGSPAPEGPAVTPRVRPRAPTRPATDRERSRRRERRRPGFIGSLPAGRRRRWRRSV